MSPTKFRFRDGELFSNFPLTPKNLNSEFDPMNDEGITFDTHSADSNNSPLAVCGSDEDIQDQLDQLEEFERQLSIEMNGIQEFSLTHLNIPMLQVCWFVILG